MCDWGYGGCVEREGGGGGVGGWGGRGAPHRLPVLLALAEALVEEHIEALGVADALALPLGVRVPSGLREGVREAGAERVLVREAKALRVGTAGGAIAAHAAGKNNRNGRSQSIAMS